MLAFLAAARFLTCVYAAYALAAPAVPPALAEIVARQAHVYKRHARPTFYDDDGGGGGRGDPRDATRLGNVDRVDVVDRGRRPLSAGEAKKLAHLEARHAASVVDLKSTPVSRKPRESPGFSDFGGPYLGHSLGPDSGSFLGTS